jgi:hypothetical protein
MCDKCYKMLLFLTKDYSEIPPMSKGKRDHNMPGVRLFRIPEDPRENSWKNDKIFKGRNLL